MKIDSSNINEVIMAILDFFVQKFLDNKKQNAYKRTKIKNAPKKTSKGKIVTYLRFALLLGCLFVPFGVFGAFCACKIFS